MNIIKDLRVLKAIEKRFDIEFDKTFKYALKSSDRIDFKGITYKGKEYKLKYLSGCFYPYLFEV